MTVTLLIGDALGGCDDSNDLAVTTVISLSGDAACVDWAETLFACITVDVVPTPVVVDLLEPVDKVWLRLTFAVGLGLAERSDRSAFIDWLVFLGELIGALSLDVVDIGCRLLVFSGCTKVVFSEVPTAVVCTLLKSWELDQKELGFNVELNVELSVELEFTELEFTELEFTELESTELEFTELEFTALEFNVELGITGAPNDVDEEMIWLVF